MCGRYTVAIQAQEAADELRAVLTIDAIEPRFNLAPTEDAPIAIEREERRIGLARFGLVPAESESPKAAGARWINLRAEGVATQRAFAESASRRRCLVIADGFYEWKREGTKKQPYHFRPVGGGLITFAGIWDIWQGGVGDETKRIPSFAILTTKPIAPVADIHDRMPMIVPPALRDRWLSPDEQDAREVIRAIQRAEPVALEAFKVSTKVGSVANDDPSLIVPLDDERLR
ncbi:SOS response-associated peptidase [Sandaracinus amylolyticus]|uniref:Abasic site processing protein n=1 Tax=Sandaracinus amylolyticus TaxID=927083 RepID=A0A0F6W5A9_9BACT|nr:SOS response-associated peptidase [Sandaracinus amylolyticus]AKF07792.1 hypothetical protein DB32_004941 [Sandaracinus amylolyticus]